MAAVDGDEDIDLEEAMTRAPRVAAAAVLLLRAPDWLEKNAAVQQRAQSIIDAAIADIPNEFQDARPTDLDGAEPFGIRSLPRNRVLDHGAFKAK